MRLPRSKALAIEDRVPFTLHLGLNGWQLIEGRRAQRTPFGLWSVTLRPEELVGVWELNFTRRYQSHWENFDHRVELNTRAVAALPHRLRDASRRSADGRWESDRSGFKDGSHRAVRGAGGRRLSGLIGVDDDHARPC